MTIDDPSYLPAMLTRVLDLSIACLEDTPLGVPGASGLYHTMPPADCCDGVYVWLERIVASKNFPTEWTGPILCGELVPVASVAVKLYRPCWPVVKDDPHNPFPPASESDIAAANLQMDAIKLFCCLMGDLGDPEGTILAGNRLLATMGGIDPSPPTGGCAAWTVRFRLELDPCCL